MAGCGNATRAMCTVSLGLVGAVSLSMNAGRGSRENGSSMHSPPQIGILTRGILPRGILPMGASNAVKRPGVSCVDPLCGGSRDPRDRQPRPYTCVYLEYNCAYGFVCWGAR